MSRKTRIIASHLSAAIAVGTAGFLPSVALGQSALEEVVVTARKREETLQETPVAVSAFSGENLTELGINDIADLTRVVPNVDMYSGNGTIYSGLLHNHKTACTLIQIFISNQWLSKTRV